MFLEIISITVAVSQLKHIILQNSQTLVIELEWVFRMLAK